MLSNSDEQIKSPTVRCITMQ